MSKKELVIKNLGTPFYTIKMVLLLAKELILGLHLSSHTIYRLPIVKTLLYMEELFVMEMFRLEELKYMDMLQQNLKVMNLKLSSGDRPLQE